MPAARDLALRHAAVLLPLLLTTTAALLFFHFTRGGGAAAPLGGGGFEGGAGIAAAGAGAGAAGGNSIGARRVARVFPAPRAVGAPGAPDGNWDAAFRTLTRTPTGTPSPTATPSRTPVHARFGVFTTDTRPLERDLAAAGYNSLGAVLNAAYAARHGYDYTYVVPVFDELALPRAAARAAAACAPDVPFDIARAVAELDVDATEKDAAVAWHPGRAELRAASWTRLPALWALAGRHEAALYIDSDAFVRRDGVRFEEAWAGAPLSLGADAARAALLLGANRPFTWRPALPCAGVILLRPRAGARDLLRRWWDARGPPRAHAYEQDALWALLDGAEPQRGCARRVDAASVAVADVPQFPPAANDSAAARAPGGTAAPPRAFDWEPASWVYHTQEAWQGGRGAVMRARLAELGFDAARFAAAVDAMAVVELDMLDIAVDMWKDTCAERADPACDAGARG